VKSSANALLVVLLFGLILVGGLLLLLPASGGSRASSVLSSEPDGWRALLLLLDELGYDARAFTGAPSELPAAATLVMAEEPPEPLARPAAPDAEETPAADREPRGKRDPLHYRRFLERGGLLVAPADGLVLDFLSWDLGLAEVEEIEWGDESWVTSIELRDGEVLELGGAKTSLADVRSLPGGSRVLATVREGDAFALAFPCGAGTVVLLPPGAARWSNAALGSDDRALAFVRLLEVAGAPRTVLFDEYALGAWTPDSPVQLAFGPHAFLLSAHLVVLAALLLWRAVWAGPFPRDPEPLARVSALARARAVARLIELSEKIEAREDRAPVAIPRG
jgi:hypothetical protein